MQQGYLQYVKDCVKFLKAMLNIITIKKQGFEEDYNQRLKEINGYLVRSDG